MKNSRRNFLAAGLALPATGLGAIPRTSSSGTAVPAPAGGLTHGTLGRTGLKVTRVGFGCMVTSDGSVIERAADMGITHFDTARGYQSGNNERMVGAALKSKRKSIILSTKSHGDTKQTALDHLDTSLKELGTDYIDIWYFHARSKPEQLTEERMEANEIAKKAGKVRFTGVSTHAGHNVIFPAVIKTGKFDVLLTSYNFTMNTEMQGLIASAKQAGMGVVAMKVMAGGFRKLNPQDRLYQTFKKQGAMVAALKWVLRNKDVDTTIPSITDMDQLDEAFKTMSTPFTPDDEKLLAAQLDYIRPLYCRMCGSCDGVCPKGLPVADVLRYLTYAEGYGQFALARQEFLNLPDELAGVRCSDCAECAIQCPNGVRVADRLIRAQELFA